MKKTTFWTGVSTTEHLASFPFFGRSQKSMYEKLDHFGSAFRISHLKRLTDNEVMHTLLYKAEKG